MAVTVAGLDFIEIDYCENITYNDMDGTDAVDYKQGSYSTYATKRASGDNDCTFTPASSKDLSGTGVHLRFQALFAQGQLINTFAAGGIQLGISDGTNTGFWYVSGKDTYPGGWQPFVVDVSASVDSGTKPTNMNAITSVIIRVNLSALAKNVDNVWIDNVCVCNGLSAYGDLTGPFSIEDIFAADNDPTLGIGVLSKFGGVYYCTGELEIGDSAGVNACDFNATEQTLIFLDKLVDSSLYGITVVDNGTGLTDFQLGTKVGSSGVSGCIIGVEDLSQTPLWSFDGSDPDVDHFKIYGSTFFGADGMAFPSNATDVEVLNSAFNNNGIILVDTAVITNCNFIGAVGNGAIQIVSTSHNVTYCNFINNVYAIEHPAQGTYSYSNLVFSGNTDDIYYTAAASSGVLTINATDSDPSTYDILNPTGNSVSIINSVDLTITVLDVNQDPIQDVQTAIKLLDSPFTVLMNEDTLSSGIATEPYNYLGAVDIVCTARKSETTDDPRFKAFSGTGQISDKGFTLTITLIEQPLPI